MAHFQIPRNLPHAATIARRIQVRLEKSGAFEKADSETLLEETNALVLRLAPFEGGDDPPDEEGIAASEETAAIGRRLVEEIERLEIGEDRLGQFVRNLFECLGLGEEGAEISLRAGENPGSLMRPV
jgi:hypothetical protein